MIADNNKFIIKIDPDKIIKPPTELVLDELLVEVISLNVLNFLLTFFYLISTYFFLTINDLCCKLTTRHMNDLFLVLGVSLSCFFLKTFLIFLFLTILTIIIREY